MPKLLIKLFLFVALNAGLLLAYDRIRPAPPSSLGYKQQIAEAHHDADTLILGSSHAAMGIVPRYLEGSAVNLANVSQDLYYDCALAERYLPQMPKLRRVILEISYFTWEFALPRSIESWREELYYSVFKFPPQQWTWKPGYFCRLGAYGFERELFRSETEPNPFDAEGWLHYNSTLNPESGKAAAARHFSSLHSEDLPANVERAARLVRECQGRGVDVVLVITPTHECYRCELDQPALRRMRETTERFRREQQVRVLDYFEDERFTTDDFADGDHLNGRGAERFTMLLQRDLGTPPVLQLGRRDAPGTPSGDPPKRL